MALKETITVYDLTGTNEIKDFPCNTDFVSKAIPMEDFRGYTLNIWMPSTVGTNITQTITLEASNSEVLASFTTYERILKVPIPELFEDISFAPKFLKIRYEQLNVLAGSTITFELTKNER